jgi:hypothetical protein
MTKQLYEEALADVKKLKEVAEDNAKRALLEAVTPRIRDLIENQLIGEMGVSELEADTEDMLMDVTPPADYELDLPMKPVASVGDSSVAASAMSMPDEEGKVTLDLDALQASAGGDQYELSLESAKALGLVVTENSVSTFETKVRDLGKKINTASSASRIIRESNGYAEALSSLISDVENTYSYLQENMQDSIKKDEFESILENYYSTLKRLMEQKMKKKNTLSEADVTLKLTGMPDELDLDSIGVDLITGEEGEDEESGEEEGGDDLDLGGEEEGEESEDSDEDGEDDLDLGGDEDSEEGSEDKMESRRLGDNVVVEIDEGMLRREISRMKALREAADMPKNAEKGHGPGEVADGFEDDDLGDPFVDVKLTVEGDDDEKKEVDEADAEDEKKDELDEMDELDQAYHEMDEMEQAYGEVDEMDEMEQSYHQATDHSNDDPQTNKQNRMPESLRRRINAELKLQLEAKKKATQAKKKQTEAQKKAQQAKKMQEKQQAKKQAKKMQEAYNFYATKFNESVARTTRLKGMLAEATRKGAALNDGAKKSAVETDLRNKLAETNLFNAKLLFTNKLLQNESLTKRQKAEVIERLDEAKNEREVKLVYESLVKTLAGTPAKITESADRGVIGSSSRPARPASATNTLNEGFESDRWARLAGIVK